MSAACILSLRAALLACTVWFVFTQSCKAKSPWEFTAAAAGLSWRKHQPVHQSGVIFSRFRPQPRDAPSKKNAPGERERWEERKLFVTTPFGKLIRQSTSRLVSAHAVLPDPEKNSTTYCSVWASLPLDNKALHSAQEMCVKWSESLLLKLIKVSKKKIKLQNFLFYICMI